MGEEHKQKNKLFFAEITSTAHFFSTVTINFAGKAVEQMFLGDDHAEKAAAFVQEWNMHFTAEWKRMCEVSTAMTAVFVKMLRLSGVPEKTLISAMHSAAIYA